MIYSRKLLVVFLVVSGLFLFSSTAWTLPVKCDSCPEEYPCATLFEFKNVRFIHHVYCLINDDGQEYWDSKDKEKFEMFYFEAPEQKGKGKELNI